MLWRRIYERACLVHPKTSSLTLQKHRTFLSTLKNNTEATARMLSLSLLTLALSTLASAIPLTSSRPPSISPRGTAAASGSSNGFYYTFWTDNPSDDITYLNGADGSYTLSWNNVSGNFLGGKGWNPGTADRKISFSGSFNPNGNSYLSVYGRTTSPNVEYYVIEDYGSYDPTHNWKGRSLGKDGGVIEVDGATYSIGMSRVISMAIGSDAVLTQVYSVRSREQRREEGTVDLAKHFEAWKKLGVKFGTMGEQIISTEGYRSSGVSEVTVEQSA